MLKGGFSESSTDVVEIHEWQGDILRAVVEYIHTDQPGMLNWEKRKTEDQGKEGSNQEMEQLLSLAAAAKYYDLPGLAGKVMECFSNKLKESPSMSFELLQACKQKGPAVPECLVSFAWSQVRSRASGKSLGTRNAVACLTQETLEEILKDKETEMTEFQLFLLLQDWVESSPTDRKPTAKQMVHLIQLNKISPEHLSTCVEPSGLISAEMIANAYKSFALAATGESRSGAEEGRFQPPFSTLVWSKSLSKTFTGSSGGNFAALQRPPMSSGVYEWTLQKIGAADYSYPQYYGVAPFGVPVTREALLGKQKGLWGYSAKGKSYAGGQETSASGIPELRDGAKVTLKLDLQMGKVGNGTLSGSFRTSGGALMRLDPIVCLRDVLNQYPGFVPIVSSASSKRGFCLLDFKKLE